MRSRRGFTLIELLAAVAIASVLIGLSSIAYKRFIDQAQQVKCVGNLRVIVGGSLLWLGENNGMQWSKEQVGNSVYRMVDDPLGVPYLLRDYVSKNAWLCPAGRTNLVKFGNSYYWTTRGADNKNLFQGAAELWRVMLFADNYDMTLPSMYNSPETGTGRLPPTTSTKAYHRPHKNRTMVNWAFADGHVILGVTAKQ
jgi:prepilin-type N-terminal cleavage/methylation domain-containing protein/prepilin-type processing-associated H-X9-DG protein